MAWAPQVTAILGLWGDSRSAAWRAFLADSAVQAEQAPQPQSAQCPICRTQWGFGHLAGRNHARRLQSLLSQGLSVEQVAGNAWVRG